MSLTVRQARDDEVELVADVLNEAAAWLEARGETLWEQDEIALATLRPEVEAGYYFIAFSGDAAVGVVRFTVHDPMFWPEATPGEAGYVHRLAVRRAWAGGKTSTAILEWAVSEAHHRGCAYLRLDCVATRTKLRVIYEHFGFEYHSDHQVGPYLVARYEMPLGSTR